MSETEPNRVHPDEIEDEQTLRALRTATDSDALTVEIDGEETELVKSATTDSEIKKAVDRRKDLAPDDPSRSRVEALAKARGQDPYKVAVQLGAENPDSYKTRKDLREAYARNPLKNRAEPLEKAKAEAYDVGSDDDSDGEGGEKAVLRHDGTIDTFPRGVIEGGEGNRRLVTSEGDIPLDDKLAVERAGGHRDVGLSWGSDEIERAASRPDERVLFVERGHHPGY